MRVGTVYPDRWRIGTLLYNHVYFVVPAEEFHGIPDKNRDFAIQFFVQAIIHFSTSLRRTLVLNTIGEL